MLKIDVNVQFESVDCLKVSGRCIENDLKMSCNIKLTYATQSTQPNLQNLTYTN